MKLYAILRRSGWRSPEDLQEAAARSKRVGDEEMADDVRWIRSYVLEEGRGSVGTICLYEAASREAIRRHASLADLPVDEIVAVADSGGRAPGSRPRRVVIGADLRRRERAMRRTMTMTGLLGVLTTIAAAAAFSQGVSQGHLEKAGWTCFKPLPTDNVHCVHPGGLTAVVTGEAETMTFLVFSTSDGSFLGTELIVRADVFNGQPCPTDPPGGQYTYLKPILGVDYYACHRYNSSF